MINNESIVNKQASNASALQNPAPNETVKVYMADEGDGAMRQPGDSDLTGISDSLSIFFTIILAWFVLMVLIIWKRHDISKLLRHVSKKLA